MGKREKQAYLEAIRNRYHKAKRADKSKILDEFCSVCGYQQIRKRWRGDGIPKSRTPGLPFHSEPTFFTKSKTWQKRH